MDSGKYYESVEDIYKDIVDLSGVRIALYFNGERNEVDKIIKNTFNLLETKKFTGTSNPSYEKRFSGYWAVHYRVNLRNELLTDEQQRYSSARIEIQVASVLMHAWSEVEHDLVYKPMQGDLSPEELSILDELNGLVLCGEIALDRLQNSMKNRVASESHPFNNHYELAAYLFKYTSETFDRDGKNIIIGKIEMLYDFLKYIDKLSLTTLTPYLASLSPETDKRSISQQIIDQIIDGDYSLYEEYRDKFEHSTKIDSVKYDAVGNFISQWINLERLISYLINSKGYDDIKNNLSRKIHKLYELKIIDEQTLHELQNLRKIRNYVVHRIEFPDTEQINYYSKQIEDIYNRLREIYPDMM